MFDVGDQITVGTGAAAETTTVTAIGTAGATGTGITVTPALQTAHASGQAVLDHAGPTGLIVKAVVDHADGTPRDVRLRRHVEDLARPTSTRTPRSRRRNGDSGDRAERYDARAEQRRLGHGRLRRRRLAARVRDRPAPAPAEPAARDVLATSTRRSATSSTRRSSPKTLTTLADGSIVADFGQVMSAMPQIVYTNGVAGRQVVVQTSFRLNNTTLSAAAAAGDTNIKVASVGNFVVGDKITVDQAANGYGKGDPEVRTITAVGTTGATGTGITLDAPLTRAHANARFVEGSRAGTSHARHAGLQPRLVVHAEGRRADRPAVPRTGAGATCRSCRPARARR